MAEDSENISELAEGSPNDVPEHSEIGVENSTTESCEDDTGRVAAVKSGENIGEFIIKANSCNAPGLFFAKEINEINVLLRDISLMSQRHIMHNCQHSIPLRDESDRVRDIATTSHRSAVSCSLVTFSMQKAIIVGKERRDKALQMAKVVETNKAAIYRALADKYDVANKVAIRRMRQLEVAAESAESASIALTAVSQTTEVSDETSNSVSGISAVQRAENAAHKANTLAGKTLCVSIKTMKACYEDLDPELVERTLFPTRNAGEKLFESKEQKSRSLNVSIIMNSFIVCVLIANASSRTVPLPYFSLRFALEAIGVGHLLYKTSKFYNEKLRVRKIEAKISYYNKCLHLLDVVYGKSNVIPGESDIELNEPNAQDPMELAS